MIRQRLARVCSIVHTHSINNTKLKYLLPKKIIEKMNSKNMFTYEDIFKRNFLTKNEQTNVIDAIIGKLASKYPDADEHQILIVGPGESFSWIRYVLNLLAKKKSTKNDWGCSAKLLHQIDTGHGSGTGTNKYTEIWFITGPFRSFNYINNKNIEGRGWGW